MNVLQERLSKYNYLELDLVLNKLNKDSIIFVKYVYMKNNPKINVLVLYKFPWSEFKYWMLAWKNELKHASQRKQSIFKTIRNLFKNSLWKRELFFWIWSLETSETIVGEISLQKQILPEDIPGSEIISRLSQEAYEIKPGLWCEHIEPTSILINNQSFPYADGRQWNSETLNEIIKDWLEIATNKKIKVINI